MDPSLEQQIIEEIINEIDKTLEPILSKYKIDNELTQIELSVSATLGIAVSCTAYAVSNFKKEMPYDKDSYIQLLKSIMEKTIETIQNELEEKLPLLPKSFELN